MEYSMVIQGVLGVEARAGAPMVVSPKGSPEPLS
jgi:hypothetical protein